MEYVLLLAMVVSIFAAMLKLLSKSNALANLQKPLSINYARCYRYGHPSALSPEEGGPKLIPQVPDDQNFRIFINPSNRQ